MISASRREHRKSLKPPPSIQIIYQIHICLIYMPESSKTLRSEQCLKPSPSHGKPMVNNPLIRPAISWVNVAFAEVNAP